MPASYDAFVSYSHDPDGKLASALAAELQRFGKPWYMRRSLRLFRDQTSLSATPALWPAIEQALQSSRYFLLLASPEAAASQWVQKEVAWWLDHKSPQTMLIALTRGNIRWDHAAGDFDWDATDLLPPNLKGVFTEEPLWVDLRWVSDEKNLSLRNPRFLDAVADLAAPLLGKPKEDTLNAHMRRTGEDREQWRPREAELLQALQEKQAEVDRLSAQPKRTAAGRVDDEQERKAKPVQERQKIEEELLALRSKHESTPPSRQLTVFLCHSSGDKPRVRDLYQRLRDVGIDPWLDEEDLLPGQYWEEEIPQAVARADAVIVCLSRTSIAKDGYVQKEIGYALDRVQEKPEGVIYLIPARLEEVELPRRLRKWHRVDLFEERGFERLLATLEEIAESRGATTTLSQDTAGSE